MPNDTATQPCPACHGEREIERDRFVDGLRGGGYVAVCSECDECEGTGRIDAADCPQCGAEWDGRRREGSACTACQQQARDG